jgi:LysR family hydrogen peroxide-inducible transcriptional activator
MPYRPSHRQLEYIVALDDVRHFGRAAARCHVSQPTLSVQVGLMEKQLGVTLFERTPSRVATTPVGEEIVRRARLALATLDDIVDLASRDWSRLGGLVRLGTAPTFGPYFLPHFLPALHRKYPELQIYIREDSPVAIEAAVAEGTLDCGLGPAPGALGLRFRKIGEEKIFLGVPAEHPLAVRTSVEPAALRGERLLALGSGHRLFENVRELAAASSARLIDDYEATSLDSIRQMVSIGMGCSLFPELYARSEFRNADDVRLVEIDNWRALRAVGFYWREGSGRQRHYESLADEADRAAADLSIASV